MNRSIVPFMIAGLSAVWLAQSVQATEQTAGAEVSKQAGDAWNTIKSYTLDKKSEAVAYGEQLMKDIDSKIGQLEAKASDASGEAKTKYNKEVENLKVVRANTAAKLDKMEKESGSAWNEAKQGFADAYKDLQHAYNKAAGKFK